MSKKIKDAVVIKFPKEMHLFKPDQNKWEHGKELIMEGFRMRHLAWDICFVMPDYAFPMSDVVDFTSPRIWGLGLSTLYVGDFRGNHWSCKTVRVYGIVRDANGVLTMSKDKEKK